MPGLGVCGGCNCTCALWLAGGLPGRLHSIRPSAALRCACSLPSSGTGASTGNRRLRGLERGLHGLPDALLSWRLELRGLEPA